MFLNLNLRIIILSFIKLFQAFLKSTRKFNWIFILILNEYKLARIVGMVGAEYYLQQKKTVVSYLFRSNLLYKAQCRYKSKITHNVMNYCKIKLKSYFNFDSCKVHKIIQEVWGLCRTSCIYMRLNFSILDVRKCPKNWKRFQCLLLRCNLSLDMNRLYSMFQKTTSTLPN